MAAALAQGAEVNRSFSEEEEGRTALIGATVGVRQNPRPGPSLGGGGGGDRASDLGLQGSLVACEFLLLNGANINHRDLRGRGALHAAAAAGHTGYSNTPINGEFSLQSYSQLLLIGRCRQVCLLLKRGANQYAADETGQDPLAIAVETAHADIVTL